MLLKVFVVAVLVVYTQAQGHSEHASSYISYSQGSQQSLSLGGYGGASLSLGGSSLNFGGSSSYGEYDSHKEHHTHPKYQFKYGVEDKHTGDIKQHEETRDGDVVKGSYSLHEPDGTILVVHYTATKKSGFNAVVQRQGHASHPHHSHH